MCAAKRPQPEPTEQTAPARFLRGLTYYVALLACIVIAMGVSFSTILHFARESVRDQTADPQALAEARSLQDYARELREIATDLSTQSDAGKPASEALLRRLRDLRRRMRQFPHESIALNALILAGDRMFAWTSDTTNNSAKQRALDALTEAESAVERRVNVLNTP